MNGKYIFLISLFSLLSIPSFSQIGELRNNWAIGFNGGVNINSVSFVPRIKQSSFLGPVGGFTVRYISEKYFSMICGIQLEANFSQRGWKENLEENPGSYSRSMNYVEVPFLVHLAFGKERGVRFFMNAGPQIGFLLSENEKISTDLEAAEQRGKATENKFDYGIAGGAGLELRTGAGNFLLEGRYYYGLADFFNNKKIDYFERSAHSVISVKATYLFDLSK